jgi:16S rRNA (guanine966-N2)-methyltransferase
MQGWINDFNALAQGKCYSAAPMQKKSSHKPSYPRRPGPAAASPHHRRRLETHPAAGARRLGLRPTPDRVRETVFNWINHQIGGDWDGLDCLDLFAGSGALGFEAASRGVRSVTMIDRWGPVVRQLETIKEKLKADNVRSCAPMRSPLRATWPSAASAST